MVKTSTQIADAVLAKIAADPKIEIGDAYFPPLIEIGQAKLEPPPKKKPIRVSIGKAKFEPPPKKKPLTVEIGQAKLAPTSKQDLPPLPGY